MKHTDDYIKKVFSEKLGEFESPVNPELWSNIASQLSQGASAGTVATAAKAISAKLIWTAAVVAITAASAITYFVIQNNQSDKQSQNIENPVQPTETVIPEDSSTAPSDEKTDSPEPIANDVTTEKNNSSTSRKVEGTSIPKSVETTFEEKSFNDKVVKPSTEKITSESVVHNENAGASESGGSSTAPTHSQVPTEIQEIDLPTAKFTIANVNKGEMRYFFMPQFASAKQYSWDFGDGSLSHELSPMHTFDAQGEYQIRLTINTEEGESKVFTEKLSVFLPGKIEVPNIFTPNGDGQNDYFDIHEKSENVEILQVTVFNRDGIVFQNNGETLWDGNDAHGEAMASGSYQYVIIGIDNEGNRIEKKGFITLKR